VSSQIFKYLFIASVLSILFCSCSGEDINSIDVITDTNPTDTFFLESVVEVSDSISNDIFNGLYVSCTSQQVFNELFVDGHFLAYGPDLVLDNGQGVFEESIYVINWSTPSDELAVGNYLAEGFLLGPNGGQEESMLFNVTITELSLFTIGGNFSSADDENERIGEFTLFRIPCESFELLANDNFLTYTDGRIAVSQTGIPEKLDLSYAQLCPDIFDDQRETTRLIFGGGKQIISPDGVLETEALPEFFIILDNEDDYELDTPIRGYLHQDTGSSLTELMYSDLIGSGTAVTVMITSDDNGYLEGIFFDESGELSGLFRSRIIAC